MTSVANKWPEVRLGEHVDLLTGFAFKSSQFTNDPHDVPLVKGANVHQGYIDWADSKYWPRKEFEKHGKFALKEGDVVLAMDRPWIESGLKYSWIKPGDPQSLLVQRVSRLRGISGLRTDYVRYLIGSHKFTDYIKPIVTGVTVPHISPSQIKDFRFRLPPLETQRKIASILSAYDDLIENNTRRIKILEEMAQALYREWFVNFRFPGHEQVKIVDSSLGRVPEGWEVVKMAAVAKVNNRSIRTANAPESINYIDISSVSTGSIDKVEPLPFAEAPSRARRIVKHGDVIWSTVRPNRKSFSLVLNPPADLIVSTGFAVISPESVPYTYLYQALTTDEFVDYLVNHATGAAYPAVNSGDFEKADFLKPTKDIVDLFHQTTEGMFLLRNRLAAKNSNLRQTRDLLLPKLIAGDFDVSEFEISV